MLRHVDTHKSYFKHIAQFIETNKVTAATDICNAHGAVLIPKHSQINLTLANKISHSDLYEPFENCIELSWYFDGKALFEIYDQAFNRYTYLGSFHKRFQVNGLLKESCRYYDQFPSLVQKMTIMKSILPVLFKQAICSAYLALAIAQQMKMDKQQCCQAFLAGLIHDIGILHLDADLVTTKGEYTPEQWQAMQRHTLIGHDLLLAIDGMPKVIAKAVLEHHERLDGSGYPFSKKMDELSIMGQILGMADTCIGLFSRELAGRNLGLDVLLPILQLNPDLFCREVFHGTVSLLNNISIQRKRIYSDDKMPSLMKRLTLENEWIQHDYSVLYGLVASVSPHLEQNKRYDMLTSMSLRIHNSLVQSGILQKEHKDWMLRSFMSRTYDDFIAMENLELMYGEIKWQMKQLKKLIFLLWRNQHKEHPELDLLVRKGFLQMEQYHKYNQTPRLQ